MLALALLGCGVPIRFAKVDDPTTPVKGVRFTLRRPGSYTAALWFDLDASTKSGLCTFQASVAQNLDGPPITYEATSANNFLTETELAFTLDEKDGALTALTAGETDQIGPFLQSLASVAAKAAPGVRAKKEFDPAQCGSGETKTLGPYVRHHVALARSLETVRAKIRDDYSALAKAKDKSIATLTAEIAKLEKSRAALADTLTADRLVLDPSQFLIKIGKNVVFGTASEKDAWLLVLLKERSQ